MKNFFGKNLFFSLAAAMALTLSACEKDEGKLPAIAFKTGPGYTSVDAMVAQGAAVLVGISADKTEDKDVLKTFTVSVSYDGGTATGTLTQALTGAQGDHFEVDVPVTTRNQSGTEKYTFTVINRDGLTNSVSLTLTVQ